MVRKQTLAERARTDGCLLWWQHQCPITSHEINAVWSFRERDTLKSKLTDMLLHESALSSVKIIIINYQNITHGHKSFIVIAVAFPIVSQVFK